VTADGKLRGQDGLFLVLFQEREFVVERGPMKMGLAGRSDPRWRSPTMLTSWASRPAEHAVIVSMALTRPMRPLLT